MPIELVPPRKGKSPYWRMRGTHLGIYVDRTCKTDQRSIARKIRDALCRAIERGEYPAKAPEAGLAETTFIVAARDYLRAGRRPRYVAALAKYFGEKPISQIDQAAIDQCALILHPNVTPASRNVYVYTPVSAILRHAGVKLAIKRPKGAKGRVITDALEPADADGVIAAAEGFDREYALLLKFLLYTGVRLGSALSLTWDRVRIEERRAWIRRTKNEDPIELQLRDDLAEAMASHVRREHDPRVFRFRQGGHLKHQLMRAKLAYLGIPCPVRRPKKWRAPRNRLSWVNHHSFRHTFATWLRRYGGADVQGLVATKNWRDPRSAARYAHARASEEWSRVERMPAIGGQAVEKGRDRA